MIKQEIINQFKFDRKTLNNWENGKQGKERQFLYYVLEQMKIEDIQKLKEDLKKTLKEEIPL
jgi:type VI protein secretion system component Hcp